MHPLVRSRHGFSLIELIIVMAVFMIVLMVTASAFNTILTKTNIVARSEESNIEGIVGLEMLRHDLEQTGFGLFTDFDGNVGSITYAEVNGSNYNDANAVPRPLVVGSEVAINGVTGSTSDYLVIKATTVARSAASQKWTYATDTGVPKTWGKYDFKDSTDKLLIVKQEVRKSDKALVRTLRQASDTSFAVSFDSGGAFHWTADGATTPATFVPSTGGIYYYYGLFNDSTSITSALVLTAPFNRSDYYISRPASIAASCSPDAGVLYKAVMNHNATSTTVGGSLTPIPILDCVADMQVVLGWSTVPSPETSLSVDVYTDATGNTWSGPPGALNGLSIPSVMLDPVELRRRLKMVKVFILAQDGARDSNFRNTAGATIVVGDEATLTKTVALDTANKLNYRWKVYSVVVKPKNLY